MRAILVGAVESTQVALRALAAAPDWTLAALVTLPPELSARHSDFVDLGDAARALGAEVVHAANCNELAVLDRLRALAPDVILVIGWSQLCGADFRAVAPMGTVGYHPAALPRLRGRGVIPWTILLDEPITAGSLFVIDAGTDSGPILAQHFFHVARDETAQTLYDKHMAALATMLPPLLTRLAAGDTAGAPQDDRYATYAARRRPEDAEIDWRDDAATIDRLIRACGEPYPGARTRSAGGEITVLAAERRPGRGHDAAFAGQVVARDDASFTVRCGDGELLCVTRWQRDRPGPPPLHVRLG
jgi:methionyl-tRNA formyltransferase